MRICDTRKEQDRLAFRLQRKITNETKQRQQESDTGRNVTTLLQTVSFQGGSTSQAGRNARKHLWQDDAQMKK